MPRITVLGIDRIERMLGVDEAANAALLLRLGHRVQRECRLTGAFRAINLDNTAARQTAHAQSNIEAQRPGGDGLDLDHLIVGAEPHDRALSEGPFNLR